MLNSKIGYIDFLSYQPQLLVNKQSRIHTYIGLILSILSCLAISVLCGFFIIQTFSRKNISVTSSVDSLSYPVANLTNSPFVMRIVSTANSNTFPNQDRLFRIAGQMVFSNRIDSSNGTFKTSVSFANFKVENCNITKHFGNYSDYFAHLPELTNSYCYVPDSGNLTLYGKLGDYASNFSLVLFKIFNCVNSTQNNNSCLPKEQINAALQNAFLSVYTLDYQFDHSNINNPSVPYLYSDGYSISNTVAKKVIKSVQNAEYSTDYGYVFEDIETITKTVAAGTAESIDLRTLLPTDSWFQISIFLNKAVTKQFRNFGKIQTLLSFIGGSANSVIFIASLIANLTTEKLFHISVINKLIDNQNKIEYKIASNKILNSNDNDTNNKSLTNERSEANQINASPQIR